MYRQLVFCFGLCVMVMSAPQDLQQQSQPPVEILHKEDVINGDGSFNYSFEAANGIRAQQSGYLKPNPAPRTADAEGENNDIQVIQGSYSYTAPDGTVISLNYTADENGFQPQGAHLPIPPEVPEAIARSLQALPQDAQDAQIHPGQQQQQQQQQNQ